MLVQVRLLNGYQKSLFYKIPDDWDCQNLIGRIIKVPLRKQKVLAFIEEIVEDFESSYEMKTALSLENFPEDKNYFNFINKLSNYYQIDSSRLISRIRHFILKRNNKQNKDNQISKNNDLINEVQLSFEQNKIFNFLKEKIENKKYCATLLNGVTGSGKTEVYKKLIEYTILEQNQSVIFLLPEVSLALQFEQNFKTTLNNKIKILSFHSAINANEKKELWNSLLKKEKILIIGVHLPVLLPISNLGLIIIDEEHDVGYQEKKHPKINSKEAAILRAQINEIPILLGSATPSINSIYNVQHRNWHFFQLKNRFSGSFPKIKIVSLNFQKKRNNFWISKELEVEILDRIKKKEQTIIFLNRRGFSFFVQCKICNFVFKCKNCSVSLTLHKNNWLYCHYCALKRQYPLNCDQCKNDKENFLKKGIGTEQVVDILQNIFPLSSIARADLDTTSKKKEWNNNLKNFKDGKIDILVGTQTITKGYHFPNVTLVGILWADLNLHFPIFNSSEVTLQQLIQVAGRAGRQSENSDVIVQTMITHKIFEYLNEVDYLKFYNDEINERKKSFYPPFIRLAEIELKNTNEEIVKREATDLVDELINNKKVQILGPVMPIVSKLKNQFMQKIYLKSNDINEIIALVESIDKSKYKSKIFFTPNPTS